MKFKGLAVLGILLAALSCSGVVSHAAAERISGEELPVEVNFTYETAPWIRDDGSVDDELAHYYRIANAEKGGREVNQFYYGAKDGIKVYRSRVCAGWRRNEVIMKDLKREITLMAGIIVLSVIAVTTLGISKISSSLNVSSAAETEEETEGNRRK